MRAFSVNNMMINGAPEHGHIPAIHLSKLRTLVKYQVKFILKNHQLEHRQEYNKEMTKQLTAASHHHHYYQSLTTLGLP